MNGLRKSTKLTGLAKLTEDARHARTKWANKIKGLDNPMIRCKECGKYYWHDFNNIQRHFIFDHMKDSPIKKERGWAFEPTKGRNKRVI